MSSMKLAHPKSTVMTVAAANRVLAVFGFGENAIGQLIATGPDGRRGKTDMLRHRYLGRSKREACGAIREWRVSADWSAGQEAHEATATLAFRWIGCRKWEQVRLKNA